MNYIKSAYKEESRIMSKHPSVVSAPVILCAGADVGELARQWPGFRWVAPDLSAPPPVALLADLPDILGCVLLEAGAGAFGDWWRTHLGAPLPGVIEAQSRDDIGPWLMTLLLTDRAEMGARYGDLSAQIGSLRQNLRDQGEELALLRGMFDGQDRRVFFDIPAEGSLSIPPGGRLTQRLPGMALGLAGVVLPMLRPARGQLTLRFILCETQTEIARWSLTNPAQDSLRLFLGDIIRLPRASAELRISWESEDGTPLDLPSAPVDDPRHGAVLNGAVQPVCLALRGKSRGFGAGILPDNPLQPRPMPRDVLAHAAPAIPGQKRATWFDLEQALIVHPVPEDISAAILPALLPPGEHQISVEIETLHLRGPEICYAIGVAPSDAPRDAHGLPDFARGCLSDWRSIPARERHGLVLAPPPAARPQDLWLMTRLADGVTDSSWAWASFGALSLWA